MVIPDRNASHELSIALRIAHDLQIYHRLDAAILTESEASSLMEETFGLKGNIVVIGSPSSKLASDILRTRRTAFESNGYQLTLNGQVASGPGIGSGKVYTSWFHSNFIGPAALFLHPHPDSTVKAHTLFILSNDSRALERAARLFPIRTGVVGPSWLLVGSQADYVGAAGVLGAG